MGRAPNRRDLGVSPGPVPEGGAAGKVQSRKPPPPPHGKKPLNEPIQPIADKITGIGARPARSIHRSPPAPGEPAAPPAALPLRTALREPAAAVAPLAAPRRGTQIVPRVNFCATA